ncbi:MAG TPA: N-6 DNA methylase [Bacteroidia bacterium]|nr:N-6 DNA methylase [Bacteroidia bacterium]
MKPFSWEKGFPDVFKQGGFNIVIGNPPWGAEIDSNSLKYLKIKNSEIIVRMIDSFMYFIHKSYSILKTDGEFGMIVPDVLLYQIDNTKLREFILKNTKINSTINLGDVFEKVVRPACILIFTKVKATSKNQILLLDISKIKREEKNKYLIEESSREIIMQNEIYNLPNCVFVTANPKHYIILDKIIKHSTKKLSEFIDEDGIQRGVSPDLKEAFLITTKQAKESKLEKSHLRNALTGGKQVKRYYINYPDLKLIYTKREDDFSTLPNICKFISQFKSKITCKEVKENKHSLYSLHRSREEKIFLKSEKLIGVITEDEIKVAIDSKKTYATDGLYLFGIKGIDIKYLMALLNSKLFVFVYRLISMESGRVLAQVKPTILNELPIKYISHQDTKHKEIIKNVENIIKLNDELKESKVPTNTEQIKQRLEYSEEKINQLVYELYNLTEKEIKIIEGGVHE